jgi:putative transposase
VLSPLAGRSETLFLIKYDPRDLSQVYFRDATGTYWPIPYRDLRLPPMSVWELRAARLRLREEGRRTVDEYGLVDTVLAQRQIVDEARRQTSARLPCPRRSGTSARQGTSNGPVYTMAVRAVGDVVVAAST